MFINNLKEKEKEKKDNPTKPTSFSINLAKEEDIELGDKWNAYSREVRVHIYVKNMKDMVRFYNKILEFPVVRYWRYNDGDGTQIDLGGNLIELFSKGKRNYSNKNYYGNVSLSLKVPDVEKLYKKISSKNINYTDIVKNPWGDSSFSVTDVEGNRIAFFSPYIPKEKYYKVKKS
tara:strand:- start:1090 stop:1614 length:525 start_codon:yes stop_codon:yes gene_type:complete